MNKRAYERIPVALEAELIIFNKSYAAFVENISPDGMYAKVAYIQVTKNLTIDMPVNLRFKIPQGKMLTLKCREKWADKNTANSLIERIGVEIINPPKEYRTFYQNSRSLHLKC